MFFQVFCNRALIFKDVSKETSAHRTGIYTGRRSRAVYARSESLRQAPVDALHAESAFLHDSSGTTVYLGGTPRRHVRVLVF
jgi:hypothetical protein